jgi:hypothetical protein
MTALALFLIVYIGIYIVCFYNILLWHNIKIYLKYKV